MRRVILVICLVAAVLTGAAVRPADAATQQFTWHDQTTTHDKTTYAEVAQSASTPPDWTSPHDYVNGRVYTRFQVLSKPSTKSLDVQICIWRRVPSSTSLANAEETCSPRRAFSTTGVFWFDYGTPGTWWKKPTNPGGFRWTSPFTPVRFMVKDPATEKLLMTGGCGGACSTDAAVTGHVPIELDVSTVVVAKGATLAPPADWGGCPSTWSAACGSTASSSTTTSTTAPTTTTTTSPSTTTTTQPSSGGGGTISSAISRIAGTDRVATSIAASRDSFADSAPAAVLVGSSSFADGLVGAPLAARRGGPLLLTGTDALDSRVARELQRLLPGGASVHLLGGTAALSPAVTDAVAALGFTPVRIAGNDRFETAVAVARDGIGDPDALLLATGTSFPDALSAAAAAAHLDGAVLLTDGDRMPDAVTWYLATEPGIRRLAIGGPAAAADPSAERIVGVNRYDTAVAVARTLFVSRRVFGLATGTSWPDALSGGAHAGLHDAPLLLTPTDHLAPEVEAHLGDLELAEVWVYGGTGAVSDAVLEDLSD